jgi:acid stress-induced BolA-like protein IbaG/YrbA
MIPPDELKALIQAGLPDATIEVEDLTGTQDHYQAVIVSKAFEGKGLVQQHKLVYQAVQAAMASDQVHALTLKTFTPAQWQSSAVG